MWKAKDAGGPGVLKVTVTPQFNRAVLFDTTMDSWHGLIGAVTCPEGHYRKSIALYYLTDPPPGTDPRGKAFFYPTKEQEGDQGVLDLIKTRATVAGANSVYKR